MAHVVADQARHHSGGSDEATGVDGMADTNAQHLVQKIWWGSPRVVGKSQLAVGGD